MSFQINENAEIDVLELGDRQLTHGKSTTLSSYKYTAFDRFISYALNSMRVNCTLFIVQYIVIWPSPPIYLFDKQVLLLHKASQRSQKSMREIDIQPFMKCNIVIKIAFIGDRTK